MTLPDLRRSEFCTTEVCPHCLGVGREIDHVAAGLKMRQMREAAKLSLVDMGKIMEKSKQYLSGLENGRKRWNTQLIERYATICATGELERPDGDRPGQPGSPGV